MSGRTDLAVGDRVRWRCPDVVGTISGKDDRGLWVVQLDRSAEKRDPKWALWAAELHVGGDELGKVARPSPLFEQALARAAEACAPRGGGR